MDSGSTNNRMNSCLLVVRTASDAANYDSIHDATVFYPTSAGDGSHSSESGSRYRGMDGYSKWEKNHRLDQWLGTEGMLQALLPVRIRVVNKSICWFNYCLCRIWPLYLLSETVIGLPFRLLLCYSLTYLMSFSNVLASKAKDHWTFIRDENHNTVNIALIPRPESDSNTSSVAGR